VHCCVTLTEQKTHRSLALIVGCRNEEKNKESVLPVNSKKKAKWAVRILADRWKYLLTVEMTKTGVWAVLCKNENQIIHPPRRLETQVIPKNHRHFRATVQQLSFVSMWISSPKDR
jgi:hypothetical protein